MNRGCNKLELLKKTDLQRMFREAEVFRRAFEQNSGWSLYHGRPRGAGNDVGLGCNLFLPPSIAFQRAVLYGLCSELGVLAVEGENHLWSWMLNDGMARLGPRIERGPPVGWVVDVEHKKLVEQKVTEQEMVREWFGPDGLPVPRSSGSFMDVLSAIRPGNGAGLAEAAEAPDHADRSGPPPPTPRTPRASEADDVPEAGTSSGADGGTSGADGKVDASGEDGQGENPFLRKKSAGEAGGLGGDEAGVEGGDRVEKSSLVGEDGALKNEQCTPVFGNGYGKEKDDSGQPLGGFYSDFVRSGPASTPSNGVATETSSRTGSCLSQ